LSIFSFFYYCVVATATGDAAGATKASPQTIKIVPPPGGAVVKAGTNQAGKQVLISKPQGGGPGQMITLVKTSSGMTVAQVIFPAIYLSLATSFV